MPPRPPTVALDPRARVQRPDPGRWLARIVLAGLLVCASLAPATADENPAPAPVPRASTREAAPVDPPKAPVLGPRLPQTRYTVRKQIESIEPVRWLERYGKVRIRELEH